MEQKNILLIEDNKAVRESLLWLFHQVGCSVVSANNGQEASELIKEKLTFNLVILDLMMPVMDGYSFRKIKHSDPKLCDIPTVIISAGENRKSITLRKNEIFLQKPFEVKKLLSIVRRYCKKITVG